MILLTLPYEILPKPHQLCAPYPKASGNVFQALVDPPNNRNNVSFDRGDERIDGYDNNTIVNTLPYISKLLALPESLHKPPTI
jgi:hypothetical protein